ncbi:SH3 domain-containing protein [Streptomyces cyaneofuscatus]|uniref:SH3 domain-containing protein n=1 Tax=Streptomyces cyaneofuscatus TaxID=66883 RepID=UPI003669797B
MSIRKRALSAGLTVTILLGGAVALAPAANAVGGHSKCTQDSNFNGKVAVVNVNLRKGPGTSYGSYGQLTKGGKVFVDCFRQTDVTKVPWLYIKVNSGAHKGLRGWVRNDLIYWPLAQ